MSDTSTVVAQAGPRDSEPVTDLLHRATSRHPERTALVDGEWSLSYAEFASQVGGRAEKLRRHGVGPGVSVAVHLARGVDYVIWMLAVIEAGGVVVPLDDVHPGDRIRRMIEISRCRAVIGVDGITSPSHHDTAPDGTSGLADAAALLFTSGSTGQPKAVQLSHAALRHFATNEAFARVALADEHVALISSPAFDAINFEVWRSLAAGATMHVLPRVKELLSVDLGNLVRRSRITTVLVPTMALRAMSEVDPAALNSLDLVFTGGDRLANSTLHNLVAAGFAGRLFNLYGPTEGTTACTMHEVTAADRGVMTPIGRPLAGERVTVRRDDLSRADHGEPGRLFIGGAGLADGYFGDPAETRRRFVPDPDSAGGARMYDTGDIGRVRADGVLEFLGRSDNEIKLRGYRVHPYEVELTLREAAEVEDAAVLVVGEAPDQFLHAVVVGANIEIPALRAHLEAALPEHMVPRGLQLVPRLPVDQIGKRDQAELHVMAVEHANAMRSLEPPANDLERYLADEWRGLLKVEHVGRTDDFFSRGGNSLLLFRLHRRIVAEQGVILSFDAMFTHPTVADLARLIEEEQARS